MSDTRWKILSLSKEDILGKFLGKCSNAFEGSQSDCLKKIPCKG